MALSARTLNPHLDSNYNDSRFTRPKSMIDYTSSSSSSLTPLQPAHTTQPTYHSPQPYIRSLSPSPRPPMSLTPSSRRHTMMVPTRPTGARPLRSSPLAGPAVSASDNTDDKKRYKPSRIASTPDLATLRSPASAGSLHSAYASDSTSKVPFKRRPASSANVAEYFDASCAASSSTHTHAHTSPTSSDHSSSSSSSIPTSTSTLPSQSSSSTSLSRSSSKSSLSKRKSLTKRFSLTFSHTSRNGKEKEEDPIEEIPAVPPIPSWVRQNSSGSLHKPLPPAPLTRNPSSQTSLDAKKAAAADNWLLQNTYAQTPKFSRLSLAAQGVVMPVSANSRVGENIKRRASVSSMNGPARSRTSSLIAGANGENDGASNVAGPSTPRASTSTNRARSSGDTLAISGRTRSISFRDEGRAVGKSLEVGMRVELEVTTPAPVDAGTTGEGGVGKGKIVGWVRKKLSRHSAQPTVPVVHITPAKPPTTPPLTQPPQVYTPHHPMRSSSSSTSLPLEPPSPPYTYAYNEASSSTRGIDSLISMSSSSSLSPSHSGWTTPSPSPSGSRRSSMLSLSMSRPSSIVSIEEADEEEEKEEERGGVEIRVWGPGEEVEALACLPDPHDQTHIPTSNVQAHIPTSEVEARVRATEVQAHIPTSTAQVHIPTSEVQTHTPTPEVQTHMATSDLAFPSVSGSTPQDEPVSEVGVVSANPPVDGQRTGLKKPGTVTRLLRKLTSSGQLGRRKKPVVPSVPSPPLPVALRS
ncbi:hypothetical protein JAAARDRAFT_38711 [Jaapia argillacea MUCL 33604]|uniref:Uncharacterized protein n=1 Tax=Jaapia argillacea MUCL 33604 TaxID=933084 RepID=A0A067PJS6_9AGAM|nr:hypothetical protein JAAARDRAFT_38711 [Jaapia argillacea MUCL 33604]